MWSEVNPDRTKEKLKGELPEWEGSSLWRLVSRLMELFKTVKLRDSFFMCWYFEFSSQSHSSMHQSGCCCLCHPFFVCSLMLCWIRMQKKCKCLLPSICHLFFFRRGVGFHMKKLGNLYFRDLNCRAKQAGRNGRQLTNWESQQVFDFLSPGYFTQQGNEEKASKKLDVQGIIIIIFLRLAYTKYSI